MVSMGLHPPSVPSSSGPREIPSSAAQPANIRRFGCIRLHLNSVRVSHVAGPNPLTIAARCGSALRSSRPRFTCPTAARSPRSRGVHGSLIRRKPHHAEQRVRLMLRTRRDPAVLGQTPPVVQHPENPWCIGLPARRARRLFRSRRHARRPKTSHVRGPSTSLRSVKRTLLRLRSCSTTQSCQLETRSSI